MKCDCERGFKFFAKLGLDGQIEAFVRCPKCNGTGELPEPAVNYDPDIAKEVAAEWDARPEESGVYYRRAK